MNLTTFRGGLSVFPFGSLRTSITSSGALAESCSSLLLNSDGLIPDNFTRTLFLETIDSPLFSSRTITSNGSRPELNTSGRKSWNDNSSPSVPPMNGLCRLTVCGVSSVVHAARNTRNIVAESNCRLISVRIIDTTVYKDYVVFYDSG